MVFPLTAVIMRGWDLGSVGVGHQPGPINSLPRGLEQLLGASVTEMGVSPLDHFCSW